MRRLQADIRVYPKNEKPKCASEDDELVQISGNYGVATDVLDIASRLGARTLHDENAGVELECAGPVLGFSLAHNLPGIGPPPSLMMGASSSGGYEPLKSGRCDHEPQELSSSSSCYGGSDDVSIFASTSLHLNIMEARYEPCFGGQYYSYNGGCDV